MKEQDEPARIHRLQVEAPRLEAGLYLVATPIGTARDITLRALDVLNSADLLAAEDTRTLRHLMDIHGIPLRGRRIVAVHDHNEERRSAGLARAFASGQSVAYCSDAGTPLVADPGFRLARDAAAAGVKIHAVPGPSAVLAALCVAGLPSDRFLFAGFPPQALSARRKWLRDVAGTDATTVLFESPRRVKLTLDLLCEIDANRSTVLCRELTKKFEEIMRGLPGELAAGIPETGLKGEIVLLLERPGLQAPDSDALQGELAGLLREMSVRDAAATLSEHHGISRRDAYQLALSLGKGE